MIDKKRLRNTEIAYEFETESDCMSYWFDLKQQKFLHQIDTFYYSVKLKNDLTADSCDDLVRKFRSYFEKEYKKVDKFAYDVKLPLYFGQCDYLNLLAGTYAKIFSIHLERPEYFDIFIAPKVPNGSDGGLSVTTEIVVQIRSYMLWIYGVNHAFEESYKYVKSILDHFGLEVDFVQENRIDYCWHSNYLNNPERFFAPDNFYHMRVDRFKDAYLHTAKVGVSDYEIDYISMGKRSDKVFIRIYLKSKEVIEKGYKSWFFKVWLFNGLINRYDFYVYEKCYLKRSWQYMNLARLEWYQDYGTNSEYLKRVSDILENNVTISPKELMDLADKLTPKVTLVMNVEYQTMRKHTKSYELVPFKDNSSKGVAARIYDYFDNRKLICDYLTHHTFRLIKYDDDSNKSRCDYCGFWHALRHTKMIDVKLTSDEVKLTRNYTRNLNAEMLKKKALSSAVTYGIYTRGLNEDDVTQDFVEVLCKLNDNDIRDANTFKKKKALQFNANELQDTFESDVTHQYNIVNIDTGECM